MNVFTKIKMSLPVVYGVCGKARHGKDTTADYLVRNHGFKKISIADPLKEACGTIFGFNKEQLYGSKKETIDAFWGCSPRKTMQYVGSELFRDKIGEIMPEIGSDIWIKAAIRKINHHFESNPNQNIVISDIRFENEYRNLSGNAFDFKLLKVYNPRVQDIEGICGKTHISETLDWSDKVDNHLLINNGSLEDLYNKIELMMR